MTNTSLAAAPPQASHYGYIPTKWICIMFIVLYFVSTIAHIGQSIRYRLWWLLWTVCTCGVLEVIGWFGRLRSSSDPSAFQPFAIQITTIIIAPTPFLAANFIILGKLISRVGQCYSRLSARWYTIIFVASDIIALVIQAAGAAMAANAVNNGTDAAYGSHVMLTGIVFQMAAITVYILLAAEFILRALYRRPLRHSTTEASHVLAERKVQLTLLELAVTSILLEIRSIYRTVELADGFTGEVNRIQWLFNLFDAAMVVLAMCTMNVLHPGIFGMGNIKLTSRAEENIDLTPRAVEENVKHVAPSL